MVMMVMVVMQAQVMLRSRRQATGSRMMQVMSARYYAQIPRTGTGRSTFAAATVDTVCSAAATSYSAVALVVVVMMALASGQDIVDHEP